MADSGMFKGTTSAQDGRFKDKEALLIKSMTFPSEFDIKVDMRKVELSVLKPWIAKTTIELLGFEDDVLIEYVSEILEDQENRVSSNLSHSSLARSGSTVCCVGLYGNQRLIAFMLNLQLVDAKKMQVLLTGFLEKKTPVFMQSLWTLLLSAQSNPLRVPTQFLEEKKKEMREREAAEAVKRRAEESQQLSFNEMRNRERGERDDHRQGPAQNRGGMRGGYGDGDRGGYQGNSNRGGGGGGGFYDRGRGGGDRGRGRGRGRGGFNDDRRDNYNNNNNNNGRNDRNFRRDDVRGVSRSLPRVVVEAY